MGNPLLFQIHDKGGAPSRENPSEGANDKGWQEERIVEKKSRKSEIVRKKNSPDTDTTTSHSGQPCLEPSPRASSALLPVQGPAGMCTCTHVHTGQFPVHSTARPALGRLAYFALIIHTRYFLFNHLAIIWFMSSVFIF